MCMLWVNYNALRFSSNNVLQVSLAVLLMAWSCNWISQMQSRAGRALSWVQCISTAPIFISSLSLVLGVLGSNYNAHCLDRMPLTCTACTMSVLVLMWGCKYHESRPPVCVEEYMYFFLGTNCKNQLQERNQVQPPQESQSQHKNRGGVEEYIEGHGLGLLSKTPAITRGLINPQKKIKIKWKNPPPPTSHIPSFPDHRRYLFGLFGD